MFKSSANKAPAKETSGFTLMEMLVVLVIVGLVSGVLIDSLTSVLRAKLSAGDRITAIQVRLIEENQLRTLLQGVVTDYPDRPNAFKGNEKEISGLSVTPLLTEQGRPTSFSLKIEPTDTVDHHALVYSEADHPPVILRTWSGNGGRFLFLASGDAGLTEWQDRWEIPKALQKLREIGALETQQPLPALIRVDFLKDYDEVSTVVAALTYTGERMLRTEDVLQMLGRAN